MKIQGKNKKKSRNIVHRETCHCKEEFVYHVCNVFKQSFVKIGPQLIVNSLYVPKSV